MYGLKQLGGLLRREQYMLNQFRNNLQVMVDRLAKNDVPHHSDADKSALIAFSQRLDNDQDLSWTMVNQVELALIDYYDDITLMTQWQRQLAALEHLPENVARFYKDSAAVVDTEKLRALLVSLTKDIQWERESKRVIRLTESQMRKKTISLFFLGFVLFLSPTIARVLFSSEFDNLRLYYIFTAASSGILGAAFSQITSIQSRVQAASLEQVRAMSQVGYIMARAMVGAGAGLIMFYLLQSGLLSGAFFPQFIHTLAELEKYRAELGMVGIAITENRHGVSQAIESFLSIGTLAQPAEGLSLLIVWCLIAGFSEKMIPGILNKKAKEAEPTKEAP